MDITAWVVPTPAAREAAGRAPRGRTYYGNAEPEGGVVEVAGAEVAVGGWAAYEATRRGARWAANPHSQAAEPLGRYPGRTYITGQDALESLLAARPGAGAGAGPLPRAAERLAAAVAAFEAAAAQGAGGPGSAWDRLGVPPDAPLAVSTLSAAAVRHTAAETDVRELHSAAEAAGVYAAAYARPCEQASLRPPLPPGPLPPLPARAAEARGSPRRGATRETANRDVLRLEAAAVPRAAAVEAYRAQVAAVLDSAAAVLERAAAPR